MLTQQLNGFQYVPQYVPIMAASTEQLIQLCINPRKGLGAAHPNEQSHQD